MLLRTLEMQGFKSFPDKTELNFGKGITAVVGPNGSGKSNISDAVRWVLGETSTKSLRGSKMEDVIFGGTATRKALGFAQVVLTLDNSDGALKDRGEVVTVSRRYYRSGESEYKIDGEQVRRRDIHELFMDTGLGADGYSMVGQGKIDSIISAKNEDRRELFEEAAGISRFRHKRRDAQRRLEQAQENLVRLLDILGELEGRVGPLKTQSEKAQKFLEYAAEKRELEIGVWMEKINAFTSSMREQEHKLDAANASYEQCEKDLQAIEDALEKIAQKTVQINTAIEQCRTAGAAFDEEALRRAGEIGVFENTVKNNNEMIARLRGEITSADNSGDALDAQIAEKEAFIAESETRAAEKRGELEQVAEKMRKLQGEGESMANKNAGLSQRIAELTVQLSDCKVKSSKVQSSMEEIENRGGAVDESMAQYTDELRFAENQRTECENNIAFVQELIDKGENALGGYRMKLQSKTDKAQAKKDELDKTERLLAEKRSRAAMLSDMEKNMEGYSGAVKAVIRQRDAHALSGVHGVLSQLISTDNEYSTAVEVALGAAMQNIVVETEGDAKKAIKFLQQNKLGRATFLPVSAMKPRTVDERDLDDNFGFVAIAADVTQCDAKFKSIVSNLLGRVIIAEDIDCAIGISRRYKNRYKIVTLDGQVMNPGGSMTGGSRSKGAGILSRANQIEELTAEADKLDETYNKLATEYKTLLEDANKSAADLQGADADLRNAKEDYIRAQGDLKLVQDKVALLDSQLKAMQQDKENAAARLQQLGQALEACRAEEARVQALIDETEAEMNKLSSGAGELESAREDIRRRSEEINLQLVTLARDSEAAKIAVEELKLRKDTAADRVQSINDEIAQIEEKNRSLQLTAADVAKEAQELRDKAKAVGDDIAAKIEERNLCEKRSIELRGEEKEKLSDKEKLSAETVRIEERKANMQKEYDNLNDMLYEQYELTRMEAQQLGIVIDDMAAAKRRLAELKSAIKKLGSVNVGAIEEYKEVAERYTFLKEQTDDVEQSKRELQNIIADLTQSMSEKFLAQFNRINEQFKISFADFFGGGKGELVLENPDDCLECAIEIKIQPPGKQVQNINLFSGGEKSLAAMALLFSVLKVTPAPFCIYDEVEAALDDVNVERFAKYMRKMTDKTQFISITHRRGTMEEADVLYGVTMQEKGVSKLLELQSAEIAAQMGLE